MMKEYYCVGQCHQGTDIAVFRSGPSDENLTLEEAQQFANKHGRGHYFFDCTPDEYHAQGDEV